MTGEAETRTLVIRNWNAGLFSNFNGVLNNLHFRLGQDGIEAAIVDWAIDPKLAHFSYGAPEDGNIWLHLFEPLAFDEFPESQIETMSFADLGMTGGNAYGMYKRNRNWRGIYHSLYRKFIRVRPEILTRVETICGAATSSRCCVGVHYRHPAHSIEVPDLLPSVEAYIRNVRPILPRNQPWTVVLATDVEPAVGAFQQAFGSDRVIVQPGVTRAAAEASEQVHIKSVVPQLALAEQVLIDCLMLARCGALVHATSNLATAVGLINPNLKMVYCETWAQAVRNRFRLLSSKPRLHWRSAP